MKKLFLLLSITILLGSGCVSTIVEPINQNSTADFEKKKECSQYLDAFKKNNAKEDTIFYFKDAEWVCYSKKYNTCVGILVHSTSRTTSDNGIDEFNMIDLLTNRIISHDGYAGNPLTSPASHAAFIQNKLESITDLECAE